MDYRTAGQWRFHVLGEQMRDRVLHRIAEFYRPRAANRPFRSLVVATRGELSNTCIILAREDIRAAALSTPAAVARLPQRNAQQQACSPDRAHARKRSRVASDRVGDA